MRIGSLFAGIGGLETGLELAGAGRTAWQVEFNPKRREWLRKWWPDAAQFTDVRTVGRHNLEPVDVICGGYPCQPYSTAGRRRGHSDGRDLWPEFARIIGEMRPRFVVCENVEGHRNFGFRRTLDDLAALGYDAEWDVISACALGFAHTRERLFCIAYPAGLGQPRPWQCGEDARHWAPPEGWQADRLVDAVRRGALPYLCREDHGLPARMDRLSALGDAVVPQVAYIVGRRLMALAQDFA